MSIPYVFTAGNVGPPYTTLTVIEDAFHRIALISEDEAPTAAQIDRGLYVLNLMLFGFEADGIQYVHTNLALQDLLNFPDQMIRNVTWLLATELADEYGKVLTPTQQLQVDRARGALQAYYFAIPVAQLDDGVADRLRFRAYGTGNLRNM